MEQAKYSVGLDIGTTKIVAIIGKENEYGKIEILGIGKSKSLLNGYIIGFQHIGKGPYSAIGNGHQDNIYPSFLLEIHFL